MFVGWKKKKLAISLQKNAIFAYSCRESPTIHMNEISCKTVMDAFMKQRSSAESSPKHARKKSRSLSSSSNSSSSSSIIRETATNISRFKRRITSTPYPRNDPIRTDSDDSEPEMTMPIECQANFLHDTIDATPPVPKEKILVDNAQAPISSTPLATGTTFGGCVLMPEEDVDLVTQILKSQLQNNIDRLGQTNRNIELRMTQIQLLEKQKNDLVVEVMRIRGILVSLNKNI